MTKAADLRWTFACALPNNRRFITYQPAPIDCGYSLSLIDPYLGTRAPATELERPLFEFPTGVLSSDVVVLRSTSLGHDPSSTPILRDIQEKLERLAGGVPSLFELAAEPRGAVNGALTLTALSAVTNNPGLDRIRALELYSHLVRAGAIHEAAEAHFQLPSGVHAAQYIRIGDALDDIVVVSRISDWLSHRITPETILLGDTWTILPLLQELGRRLTVQLASAGKLPPEHPPVYTFPGYPTPEEVRALFQAIQRHLIGAQDPQLLVITSVTSSGRVISRALDIAKQMLPGVRVGSVILVATTDDEVDGDVFVRKPVVRYDVQLGAQCRLCSDSDRAAVVSIDPKRYTPRVEVVHLPQMIRWDVASKHRDFWETADRLDAVAVHAEEESKGVGRHLPIEILVDKLLDDPQIRIDVERTLASRVESADCVIIPENFSTRALAEIARVVYPNAAIVPISRPPLASPESETAQRAFAETRRAIGRAISGAHAILILDEVAVSGGTLRAVHRAIQDVARSDDESYRPASDYRVFGFVVLARPEHLHEWAFLTDSLRQGAGQVGLRFLGQNMLVPMPNSACPWCEEDALLSAAARALASGATGASPPALDELRAAIELIEQRRQLLSASNGSHRGLRTHLFLCSEVGDLRDRSASWISSHSLFGEELSEAAAFAAMASAMHELRTQADEQTHARPGALWGWNLPRIVNAYHDPLLQASFLRAVDPFELRLVDPSRTESAIRHVLFSSTNLALTQTALLAAEHALAAIAGKYPPVMRASVFGIAIDVVKQWSSEASVILQALAATQGTAG